MVEITKINEKEAGNGKMVGDDKLKFNQAMRKIDLKVHSKPTYIQQFFWSRHPFSIKLPKNIYIGQSQFRRVRVQEICPWDKNKT